MAMPGTKTCLWRKTYNHYQYYTLISGIQDQSKSNCIEIFDSKMFNKQHIKCTRSYPYNSFLLYAASICKSVKCINE